jgi:hypothetical protein
MSLLATLQRPTVGVAVLVFGGYSLLARTLQNLYPVSSYPMYAMGHADSGSRLGARDRAGRLRELRQYTDWSCERPLRLDTDQCAGEGTVQIIGYLERDMEEYLAQHRAAEGSPPRADAEPVELVRHIWWFDEAGRARSRVCVMNQCRAVPTDRAHP